MNIQIRKLIQKGLQARRYKKYDLALDFFHQALELANQLGDLETSELCQKLIDSIYKIKAVTEKLESAETSSTLNSLYDILPREEVLSEISIDDLESVFEPQPEDITAPPPSPIKKPPPPGAPPSAPSTPTPRPPAASLPQPIAPSKSEAKKAKEKAVPEPVIDGDTRPLRLRRKPMEPRPKKIKRFGDVSAPMEMTVQKEYMINVGLRVFKEDVKGMPVPMTISVPEIGPPIIEVFVIGRDFQIDQSRRTLVVPLDQDSDILNFRVTPKTEGIGSLTVEFYQEGTLIGRAILKIVVKKKKEPISEGTSSTSVVVSSPAELRLDATLRIIRYDNDFFFSLFTPRAKAVISQSALFGKASINTKKLHQLELLIEKALFDDNPSEALIHLQKLGAQIYDAIPKSIRKTIDLITPKYFIIETGDLLVPWELAFDGQDFLCSKYCLGKRVFDETRDFRPPPFCIGKKILDVIFIGASPSGVPEISVDKELEFFDVYHNTKRINLQKLIEPGAAKSKVLELLAKGDLIHFTCHGKFEQAVPTESALLLSDDILTAKEINEITMNNWPLIFANACSTGAMSDKVVGIGGIARSFLESGAIAFLGPLFEIPDDIAVEFAKQFYNDLLYNDVNIGEAILNTRKKLREQFGGAFWAIFSLYGDPTLNLCKA